MGTPTFGSSAVYEATLSQYNDITVMDSTHAIAVYQGTDDYGYAVGLSVSGTTVTAGTAVAFHSSVMSDFMVRVCAMDSTHAVVTFADATTDNGTAVCLTLSGTTITVNTPVDYDTGDVSNGDVCSLSATLAMLTYDDNNDTSDLKARILSLSGTTLTVGAATTFDGTAGLSFLNSISALDATHAIVAYYKATSTQYSKLCVMSVSGTTITAGTAVDIVSASELYLSPDVSALSATRAIVVWRKVSSSLFGMTVDISGTTITQNAVFKLDSGVVANTPKVVKISATYAMVAYTIYTSEYCRELTIDTDGNIIQGDRSAAYDTGVMCPEICLLDGNKCTIGYAKSSVGTAIISTASGEAPSTTPSSIGVDIARSYRENALTGANISREWIANATIIGIDIARDHRAFQTATINIARGIKGQQITGVDISRSMRSSRIIGVDVSHNIKGTAEAAIFIDRKFLTLSGFHIYVDNVFQGVTTDGTLAGIPLADGSHSIEIRPSGDLWEACRYPTFYEIEVASGEIVAQDLPDVVDLRADDLTGWGRDIFWTWQNDWNVETPTEFGLWFGDTSPVTISGTPDATVTAQAANRNHSYRYAQTAAKYVSVAARNAAGDNGTATELLLSYPSGSISSPTWQDAREGI